LEDFITSLDFAAEWISIPKGLSHSRRRRRRRFAQRAARKGSGKRAAQLEGETQQAQPPTKKNSRTLLGGAASVFGRQQLASSRSDHGNDKKWREGLNTQAEVYQVFADNAATRRSLDEPSGPTEVERPNQRD
jgi:hypothetical protein